MGMFPIADPIRRMGKRYVSYGRYDDDADTLSCACVCVCVEAEFMRRNCDSATVDVIRVSLFRVPRCAFLSFFKLYNQMLKRFCVSLDEGVKWSILDTGDKYE